MPIYEYQCAECAGKFEVLTSFSQREKAHSCPACSSARTEVLVSSFASHGGGSEPSLDFAPSTGGGGCACGGACSCGGH